MAVLLLLQAYDVVPPDAVVPKVTAVLAALLQTTWLAIVITVTVGFTVIVNVVAVPTQLTLPLVNVGVTVIVALIGAEVVFVAVKLGKAVPLAAKPIAVLLLLQA